GRAVAIAFARECADVAIVYLEEDQVARDTEELVRSRGRRCLLLKKDISEKRACDEAVEATVDEFGRLDVLVNNAAEQHPQPSITDIDEAQLVRTFRTNLFSMFFLTGAALPHLRKSDRASIINTSSVTAYR